MSLEALKSVGHPAPSILSAAHAIGAVEGSGIDTIGFEEALVVVMVGTVPTGATLDVTVGECDTEDGTYAAIEGAAFAQFTETNHEKSVIGIIRCGSTSRLRYLQAVGEVAGDAVPFSAAIIPIKERSGDGGTYGFIV